MTYDTHGYDAVLELAETEIDELLACRFATGKLAPPRGGTFDVGKGAATVEVNMLFDTPWSRLVFDAGQAGTLPGVTVTLPFDDSFARATPAMQGATDPADFEFRNLRGEIHVTAPFAVKTGEDADTRSLVVRTGDGTLSVEVAFDEDTRRKLDGDGERLAGIYRANAAAQGQDPDEDVVDQLENLADTAADQLAGLVREEDGALPDFPLDMEVEALTMDVKVVEEASGSGRCLLVLVERNHDPARLGRTSINVCQRPVGVSAATAISSDHILHDMIRPTLVDELNLPDDRFDYPCDLSRRTDGRIESEDGTTYDISVHRLKAWVDGAQFVLEGEMSTERKNATVTAEFTTRIDVTFEDGALSLSVADVDTNSHVDLPWYLDLIAFVPFVGVFTVLIGQSLAERAANRALASDLRSNDDLTDAGSANDSLQGLLDRMEVETFSMDETAMVFGGGLLPGRHCRPAASGQVTLSPGERFDLDRGKVISDAVFVDPDEADLLWGRGDSGDKALRPRNGARRGVIGRDAWRGEGSVLSLEAHEDDWWSARPIDRSRIPQPWEVASILPAEPLWLRFGVYTSEGRYAKCGARRKGFGGLELTYHTFDRPTPELSLGSLRHVTEEQKIDSGVDTYGRAHCHGGVGGAGGGLEIDHAQSGYMLYERAFRIECVATHSLLAYPLQRRTWRLDGQTISGQGSLEVDGHRVGFAISEGGDSCELTTEKGKALDTSLSLEIVDDRGLSFSDAIDLDIPAQIKEGGLRPGMVEEQEREIARCFAERAEGFGPGGFAPFDELEPDDLAGRGGGGARPDPAPRFKARTPLSAGRQREKTLQRAVATGMQLDASEVR